MAPPSGGCTWLLCGTVCVSATTGHICFCFAFTPVAIVPPPVVPSRADTSSSITLPVPFDICFALAALAVFIVTVVEC